mmetsp:Transcript_1891/g.1792  ORF Transcript_1891/g.1792 Transcript_1891/m.1792 type:complete len:157 (-) Transcript_1891:82-552(-)
MPETTSETPTKGYDWIKVFKLNSQPNAITFPTLPDVIVYFRMIIALGYGISLGHRGQVGGVGIMFGINCITFIPIMYLNFILNANVDSYTSINFVGLPNAIALMLLIWIFMFTLEHEEDELALVSALVNITVMGNNESAPIVIEDSFTAPPVETEF